MGWLGWLRGGSEELGFDDLVKRVAEALAKLARYVELGLLDEAADEVDAALPHRDPHRHVGR